LCGITGIAWTDGRSSAVIDSAIKASIQAVCYRGPDSSGAALWQPDERVGAALGSARLAVLDGSALWASPRYTAIPTVTSGDGMRRFLDRGRRRDLRL